jgi:glycosyltransferase involved in cell wall biosynthesis
LTSIATPIRALESASSDRICPFDPTGWQSSPGLVREIELPLAISDLYVTANVGSVPGVAGLQAVAAGLPVIAMQLREDYSGDAADWIWSSNDPDAIAARAMVLIGSPEAARELADRQARHLRAHHSAEAMAANYDLFYRDAIQAKVGSGKKLSGSQNTCN